jgi:hypothetical protein
LRNLCRRRRDFDARLDWNLWVQRADEPPRLFVGDDMQDLPLVGVEGCCSQHRRGNGQAVRCEIFEQTEGQWKRGNGPRSRRAKSLIDARPFVPDGFKRLGNDRACAVRTGASDEVDQLAPANRRVVAVFGRLV